MPVHTNGHEPNSGLSTGADDVLDKLRDLVSEKYTKEDTAAMHIRSMALLVRLKTLYRAAHATIRVKREESAAARHEMDQSHLNLQNLLYEKHHLEREIEKCRQFASVYQDITLYTLEDFSRLAPPPARTAEVLADEHQLMLNRLSFELSERQRLDYRKKELLQQKEALLKESKAKSTTKDNVKNQIDILMKAAADVQKKVNDLIEPKSNQTTTEAPAAP